jgi:fatty acyl-CoA reductase
MMVAMATHYNDVGTQVVYHVASTLQNPLPCNIVEESTYAYSLMNPHARDDKKTTKHKRPLLFSRYVYFYTYMILAYKTRLQVHIYLPSFYMYGYLAN